MAENTNGLGGSKASQIKSFFKILFGSAGGQILLLISPPFFSRIYGLEQFADYAIVLSITNILGVVISLRLENAVFYSLGLRSKIAFTLAILVAIILSILIFSLLWVTYGLWEGYGDILICGVLGALGLSLFNTSCAMLNAVASYDKIALLKIARPAIEVLIAICIVGMVDFYFYVIPLSYMAVIVLAFPLYGLHKNIVVSRSALWRWFLKNKGSVFYDTPASLCVALSSYAPFLILGLAFDKAVLGLYALAFRVVIGPINTILQSVSYLSRKGLSDASRKGDLERSFQDWKVKLLVLGGLLLFFIIGACFFNIFTLIFGEEWQGIEVIILALSPLILTKVVSTPLSFVFIIKRRLRLNLIIQALGIVITTATLLFFTFFEFGFNLSVLAYSISYALFYIIYFRVAGSVAKNE